MADFGQALNNPVVDALNMFNSQLGQLQTTRALQKANDQVQQIRDSELKDNEKLTQYRNVAQDLTSQMAQGGASPSDIAAAVGRFPSANQPLMQSPTEVAIYGTDEQKKALRDQQRFQNQLDINKIRAKPHEVDPLKDLLKKQTAFAAYDKAISPDKARFGTFGMSAKTIAQGQNLQAMIGSTPPDKLTPTQLYEGASAFGQMVKNGVLTHDELQVLFPQTRGMAQANLEQFFQNRPMPANSGAFAELYLKGAIREMAMASSRVEDSILSSATTNSLLSKMDYDHFKEATAAKINQFAGVPIRASDIIITPQGKVTTKLKETADIEFRTQMENIQGAKKALSSADPVIAGRAKKFLTNKGLNEKQSIREMGQVIKYKVMADHYSNAKYQEQDLGQ